MRGRIEEGSRTITLATVQLPQGIPAFPQLRVDELMSDGVDGSLVVNNRYEFSPFQLSGIASYTSLVLAQQAAEFVFFMRGKFCRLTLNVLGSQRTWRSVHVVEANAVARPDRGGGAYAVASQLAIAELSMVLRFSQRAT